MFFFFHIQAILSNPLFCIRKKADVAMREREPLSPTRLQRVVVRARKVFVDMPEMQMLRGI